MAKDKDPAAVLLGDVQRNQDQVVRVIRRQYKGETFVDARVFVRPSQGGEPFATHKGLCLRPAVWREILPILMGEVGIATGEKVTGAPFQTVQTARRRGR